MKLYLVQHGKSLSRDVDPEKGLSMGLRASSLQLLMSWNRLRASKMPLTKAQSLISAISDIVGTGSEPCSGAQSLITG